MRKVKYSNLYYPGFFGIELDSSFQIYDKNLLIGSLTLIKHHVGLEYIDLNSRIQQSSSDSNANYTYEFPINKTNGVFINKVALDRVNSNIEKVLPNHNIDDLAILYELNPLPRVFKNIHFSEIMIEQEFEDGDKENDYSKETRILELFITKYREITNDINIKLPSKFHWNMFGVVNTKIVEIDKEKNNVNLNDLSSNTLTFDIRDYRRISKPTFDFEKTTTLLTRELMSGNVVDDFLKLSNSVVEEIYIYSNYKYALLEVFIFCEKFVAGFLKRKKIEKGISNKKIDEMEVTFSYLLNIELPLLLDKYDEDWKTVIGNVNGIRKKRNNVVHNGETVTKNEAIKALESIEKLIKKIGNIT